MKPRKPRPFLAMSYNIFCVDYEVFFQDPLRGSGFATDDPKDLRKLAAWLIKSADWIEAKEGKCYALSLALK